VVLAGTYRILIEDKVFDAPASTNVTVPKGSGIAGGTYPMRLAVFW